MMYDNLFEQRLRNLDITVFDLETTGLSPTQNHIIQMALVQIKNGELTGNEWEWKINPGFHIDIPAEILTMTALDEAEIRASPTIEHVYPLFGKAIGDSIVAGHNVSRFDLKFVRAAERRLTIEKRWPYIDTLKIAKRLKPNQKNHKLITCAREYELDFNPGSLHDALVDTRLCAELLICQLDELERRYIYSFGDLVKFLS